MSENTNYPFNLGPWSRTITTTSADTQIWFDRGLNWTYAYNQEEAVSCFKRALTSDQDCAMAWWGIAYAAGPFYNRPWIRFSDTEIAETLPLCRTAALSALERIDNTTGPERLLIEAIPCRYQNDDETNRDVLNSWHIEYTQAMRNAYAVNPDDLDIAALFAEAAVTCTPRQLWDLKSGTPKKGALTEEAVAVLEDALQSIDATGVPHPGVMHMYIHALEMSPYPERALTVSDLLRGYAPDAGHLEHMAAHIYVQCGDYAQAVEQSRRAVFVDDRYVAHAGASNFYTTARCHDLHLYMYAAMMLGQLHTALEAADRICTTATPDLLETSPPFMSSILDGYSAMRTHVLVRFGQWHDLITEPAPEHPDLMPIRVAMHAYGQGVAHSALGNIVQAESARNTLLEQIDVIPDTAVFLSNTVADVLAVAAAMLDGELAYRQEQYDEAFDALRLAVSRDDSLNYTEPWAWMHPPRHALGALLAEQGRYTEATAVYRADLGLDDSVARCCQHPDNVWALHGLLECLEHEGNEQQANMVRQKLTIAQARTDVPVQAACCCRTTTTDFAH